jgi:hypothetical protein
LSHVWTFAALFIAVRGLENSEIFVMQVWRASSGGVSGVFMVTVALSEVLLFVAVAQYSDGVKHLAHGTKHPQIFCFSSTGTEACALDVCRFDLIECPKEVFIRASTWYLLFFYLI